MVLAVNINVEPKRLVGHIFLQWLIDIHPLAGVIDFFFYHLSLSLHDNIDVIILIVVLFALGGNFYSLASIRYL